MIRNRFAGPLLLLILVAAANYNIVFFGQTLVASSNYDPVDFGTSHLRPGVAQGRFALGNWHDLGVPWLQWEPAGKMFSKAFRAGRIPLWDAAIGGGVDSHVSVTQGQYYPPYILLLLAGDTPLLRDVYYLLQVFGAGLFCYLLLRSYGCHVFSATTMGVAYMLGGSLTQTVNSIEGQSVAVLPAMVWAVSRVFRVGTWRVAAVAALILATAALSSFLPVVISGYLLVAIFIVVQLLPQGSESRLKWRQLLKPAAALLVSLLLVGFLWLPLRAASRQDETFSQWYAGSGLISYPIDRLLTLISPSVSFDVYQTFGAASSQLFSPGPNVIAFSGAQIMFFYVGLIPILLSFLAYPKVDHQLRRLYFFFLTSGVFLLLKLLGIGPAQWLAYVPPFRDIHFVPYFGGALNFAIAGLAGIGVEQLMRERSLAAVGAGILGIVAVFTGIVRFAQTQPVNPLLQGQVLWSVVAHYGLEIARLVLLSGGFLAVLLLRRGNLRSFTTGALMLVLVVLDLGPLAARPRFLRSDAWVNTPDYVRFLQSDKSTFRIHSTSDLALNADTSQAFGLQVLSSRQSFNSTRYTDLLRKYFAAPLLPYPLAKSLLPSARPLLDLLNVKYLVLLSPTPQESLDVSSAGFFPKSQDRQYQIFQNKTVWDRAYLASSVRLTASPEACLNALGDLRPGEAAVERQPAIDLSAKSSPGTVEAIHYDQGTIKMRVHALRPALLVLDENYSPGWRAQVQQRPVGIQRANYAFQAVTVPEGVSEVVFRYVPEGFYAGWAVTGLGLLLVAAMLFAQVLTSSSTTP